MWNLLKIGYKLLFTIIIDFLEKLLLDPSGSEISPLSLPRRFDELIEMPREVEEIIYGEDGERFISEVHSMYGVLLTWQ